MADPLTPKPTRKAEALAKGHPWAVILLSPWSGESSGELENLGETWWKSWLSVIIKIFMSWLSNPVIIRLFPDLDYHESVILQKTSLKGLILIIKSTHIKVDIMPPPGAAWACGNACRHASIIICCPLSSLFLCQEVAFSCLLACALLSAVDTITANMNLLNLHA
jgi:hypothetical protein